MAYKDLCLYVLGDRYHIRTNSYYDHVKEIENIIIYSKIPKSANRLLKCRFWICVLLCVSLYMAARQIGFEIWVVTRGNWGLFLLVLEVVDSLTGPVFMVCTEARFLQKAIQIIEKENGVK